MSSVFCYLMWFPVARHVIGLRVHIPCPWYKYLSVRFCGLLTIRPRRVAEVPRQYIVFPLWAFQHRHIWNNFHVCDHYVTTLTFLGVFGHMSFTKSCVSKTNVYVVCFCLFLVDEHVRNLCACMCLIC